MRPSTIWNTIKLTALDALWGIENRLGCVAPTGLAYKSYSAFAGELACMCCTFWRGVFTGTALTLVILLGLKILFKVLGI